MLIGLMVLVVGFLVPPKIEALGKDDFVVVDTRAIQFNGSLDICKLSGAILFCIGGTAMAACLLMAAFAKSYSKEEKYLQQRFKERIADIKAHANPVTKAPAPGESKIPVTLSKVQNVQPSSQTWPFGFVSPFADHFTGKYQLLLCMTYVLVSYNIKCSAIQTHSWLGSCSNINLGLEKVKLCDWTRNQCIQCIQTF